MEVKVPGHLANFFMEYAVVCLNLPYAAWLRVFLISHWAATRHQFLSHAQVFRICVQV